VCHAGFVKYQRPVTLTLTVCWKKSVKKTVAALMKTRKTIMVDVRDCVFNAVRGGGPGGQAVAKTSNMAVVFHRPSGITVKVP
jgi:protein subunit release factor B